jgi:hypothetical protein
MVSHKESKANSQAPPKSNILSLSPFGIKRENPKRLQVEAERTSHEEQPQTVPSHHLYPHQSSAGKLY